MLPLTLPHNSNPVKWRRGAITYNCKLCGHKQTILHILNHCEVALQLHRYNQRHDRVLAVIADVAKSFLPDGYHLTVDLDDSYEFSTHITPTSLQPDLVVWTDSHKTLYLVELTVCFESGFEEVPARKAAKYMELVLNARKEGFHTEVIPLQGGEQGECWRTLGLKTFEQYSNQFHLGSGVCVTTTVMQESHRIWSDRNKTGRQFCLFVYYHCHFFMLLLVISCLL